MSNTHHHGRKASESWAARLHRREAARDMDTPRRSTGKGRRITESRVEARGLTRAIVLGQVDADAATYPELVATWS